MQKLRWESVQESGIQKIYQQSGKDFARNLSSTSSNNPLIKTMQISVKNFIAVLSESYNNEKSAVVGLQRDTKIRTIQRLPETGYPSRRQTCKSAQNKSIMISPFFYCIRSYFSIPLKLAGFASSPLSALGPHCKKR